MPEENGGPETPAKLSIYEALPLITADIGAVGKNNKNRDQGYAFRGIDDVVNGIHSLFARYGVGCIPRVLEHKQDEVQSKSGTRGWHTVIKMQYKLTARDGTNEIGEGIGESLAYDDKGTPKAQAMAFKYFLTQAFTIPTEENLDTEYDKAEEMEAPKAARKPDPKKGERSAHDDRQQARGANDDVPPPEEEPPAEEPPKPRTGLANSKAAGGLKRKPGLSPAPTPDNPMRHPVSDNDGAGPDVVTPPKDQWEADALRKVLTLGGKPLGTLTKKQLTDLSNMGEDYFAQGERLKKRDVAVKAVETAKALIAFENSPEEALP